MFYGGCTELLFHSQVTRRFPSSIHRGRRLQSASMFPTLLKLSAAYLQPTYYFLHLFLELINLPKLSALFLKDRGKDSQCQVEV